MMPENSCADLHDEAPEHLSSVTVSVCAIAVPIKSQLRCLAALQRADDYIFVIKE